MVVLEKENYRISTISRLTKIKGTNELYFDDMPISYGLDVCKKCKDGNGNSWYVIFTIKYDSHEGEAGITDDCCGRLLDVKVKEWAIVRNLYKQAKELVEDANKGE